MLQVMILTALCAVFATIFLRAEMHDKYVSADVWKGFASLCFVLIGVLNSPGGNVAELLVCGLILGFIADILLNLRDLCIHGIKELLHLIIYSLIKA